MTTYYISRFPLPAADRGRDRGRPAVPVLRRARHLTAHGRAARLRRVEAAFGRDETTSPAARVRYLEPLAEETR